MNRSMILITMGCVFSLGVLTGAKVQKTECENHVTSMERETSMEATTMEGGSGAEAPSFSDLLDAIQFVESGNRELPYVYGADGEVGVFQLKEIYVNDVNRINRLYKIDRQFTYDDRLWQVDSRNMTSIYLNYYWDQYCKDNPRSSFDENQTMEILEIMARIHNGGPQGYKKESTKAYWLKVKERLEQ